MKRIKASQSISKTVIKESEQIDKLEESIQFQLLQSIAKEVVDCKLIQVKKSEPEVVPSTYYSCVQTIYEIEMFIMSPTEFKEICIVLEYLKAHTLPFTARNCVEKLEKIIKDLK